MILTYHILSSGERMGLYGQDSKCASFPAQRLSPAPSHTPDKWHSWGLNRVSECTLFLSHHKGSQKRRAFSPTYISNTSSRASGQAVGISSAFFSLR